MEMIRYPATIEQQEDGRFFVQFVDLLDTFTEGQTQEEALFNASEVLTGMLDCHLAAGRDIPAPSQGMTGVHYVSPDVKTQAALLVRSARGERSMAELARALETSWPAARRLEDTHHWPSLKTLDRVATTMGKRLVLAME
jgi:antitoxin HicB